MSFYRSIGAICAYMDETWVYRGMKPTIRPAVEKDKGTRAIVVGILTEDGILENSESVFSTGKKPDEEYEDYHKNMDTRIYEAYMKRNIPNLAKMSMDRKREVVLIVDNAPYHCRMLEKVKERAVKWLRELTPESAKKLFEHMQKQENELMDFQRDLDQVKNADLLLARSLKSLTIDDFPFPRTNEDVKNRGEQIVQNLVSALKIIKNRLGDCAKGSIFDNIEVAARALTGISASSIRRRLDEIPETKRPEKRQWISRTSIYKAAGEGISEYKKELIRKRLEYCWKNEELVTVSSLSEWCKNIPTSTSKKKEYCSFLLKNGKVFHPRIKRKELWESVKDVIAMNGGRLRMRKYEIDEWARTEHGVEIVRLPPYHCSLNAIEFVWAQLKNQLKSIGKTTDKLETIIERTRSFLENFSPVKAINLLNHVRKHEDAKRQAIIDGTIVSNDESDDTEDGDDELDYNDE
ncbi:unnamed protein product [Caenorhabditis bovis]|uniref:Tc1-like transposase DDE domain-containing protein n=1 Tax=Caenorhabditis bovis TaxID=2654633 RepID=A0A8S1EEE1_9PELO|nr:unnamed protein product [Caenorhabditis bovis]